jgi:hypothetical protein
MAQNILGILNKFLTFWLILHDYSNQALEQERYHCAQRVI